MVSPRHANDTRIMNTVPKTGRGADRPAGFAHEFAAGSILRAYDCGSVKLSGGGAHGQGPRVGG